MMQKNYYLNRKRKKAQQQKSSLIALAGLLFLTTILFIFIGLDEEKPSSRVVESISINVANLEINRN